MKDEIKFPEEKGKSGFTYRACIIAVILTLFLVSTSSYIALKIGALPWPIIFSVIVAGAILKLLARFSRSTDEHEINVAQAGGTIGGLVAAGVVFTIPGILYLQQRGIEIGFIHPLLLALVCIAGGLLGILLSIPVRRVFIDEENLPYPSGRAGAEVLKAETQIGKSTFIIAFALLLAGIFALTRDIYFPAGFAIASLATVGILLTLYPMPLAVGVGYILGHKISFNSWFFGSLIGWVVIIPYLIYSGLEQASSIALIQNLGMGIVLGSGIGFFVAYVIPKAKRIFLPLFQWRNNPWYIKITPLASLLVFLMLWGVGVPWIASLLSVVGVWIMVTVAARITGETNIDPLEQFGIIIGLLALGTYALLNLSLGYLPVFLVVMFVSIACALAGDIGHDYKSAKIIGTKVKDIIKVDMLCVIFAGLLAPFVLEVILRSYSGVMFTQVMPAPQAQLVASSIAGFAHPNAFYLGFILAFLGELVRKFTKKEFPLSLMAFGIGMFLGLTLGILLAIGGLIRYFIDKKHPNLYHSGLLASTGLMGGEGIAGFVLAALFVYGLSYTLAAKGLMGIFLGLLIFTIIWHLRARKIKN